MAGTHFQEMKVKDSIQFEEAFFLMGSPNLDDILRGKVANIQ